MISDGWPLQNISTRCRRFKEDQSFIHCYVKINKKLWQPPKESRNFRWIQTPDLRCISKLQDKDHSLWKTTTVQRKDLLDPWPCWLSGMKEGAKGMRGCITSNSSNPYNGLVKTWRGHLLSKCFWANLCERLTLSGRGSWSSYESELMRFRPQCFTTEVFCYPHNISLPLRAGCRILRTETGLFLRGGSVGKDVGDVVM